MLFKKITGIINFYCLLYIYLYLKEIKSLAVVSVHVSTAIYKTQIFFQVVRTGLQGGIVKEFEVRVSFEVKIA